MKKVLLAGVLLMVAGCSNSELEQVKKANEEMAVELVKLRSENKALQTQLDLVKLAQGMQKSSGDSLDSDVKANMHTFQTLVETYAVDWGGVYPENAEKAMQQAQKDNYMPERLSNPVSGQSGYKKSVFDGEPEPFSCNPGSVYYKPSKRASKTDQYHKPGEVIEYEITGCTEKQIPVGGMGDGMHILTNS